MSDYRDAFLADMRAELYLAARMPRKVTKPKGDLYRRLSEGAIAHAHQLSRPTYWDPPGFTDDRWLLRGEVEVLTTRARTSISGCEKVYGWASRPFWREAWRAVKYAFASGIADATGATYETTEGGRNDFVHITGLTS